MKSLFWRMGTAAAMAASLAGCAVGPNFHSPPAPAADGYTATSLPARTASAPVPGGAAQRFAFAREVSAQWWTLFRSPALDTLVKRGLADSPTLAAARAALRTAEESLSAAGGALLYPGVDANLQASRQRYSGIQTGFKGGEEFDLYNASVQVSYRFDLFGSSRRQLEALQAQVDYRRYQLEAAYLALAANIVTGAVQDASLSAQIAATREVIGAQRKLLQVVEGQFRAGAVARSAVLSQQSQVAATLATLPPLEKQLSITRHALSVLLGQFPSQAKLPPLRLDALRLPETLPVSLPSALARQRPDIRAAEALLHEASAQVGVATANLYPQLTLSASYGAESLTANTLFDSQNAVWNVGLGLLQPVFHGGELHAKRRAAVAAFDQAAAQYRQTVLNAFQNVADALRALDADAQGLKAQADFSAAAQATLDLTQRQYAVGAVSYASLLTAERDYQQARLALVKARAARYADTAALFQALGGGWWDRHLPAQDTASTEKGD